MALRLRLRYKYVQNRTPAAERETGNHGNLNLGCSLKSAPCWLKSATTKHEHHLENYFTFAEKQSESTEALGQSNNTRPVTCHTHDKTFEPRYILG